MTCKRKLRIKIGSKLNEKLIGRTVIFKSNIDGIYYPGKVEGANHHLYFVQGLPPYPHPTSCLFKVEPERISRVMD